METDARTRRSTSKICGSVPMALAEGSRRSPKVTRCSVERMGTMTAMAGRVSMRFLSTRFRP